MSTFSRLTLLAQYDDMCRLVNKLIKDRAEEEDATIRMLTTLQKRWNVREQAFDKEKNDLKSEINGFQREIKKLNRQLVESRSALVRESNEKKNVAREKKELMDRFRQVKLLVESSESLETDAHRRRVIKCLDVDRLPAIQSDDSEDSDQCVELDYDKTEEDIMEPMTRQTRRSGHARQSNGFIDVLENLPDTEQPTILCRLLDNRSDDDQNLASEQELRQQQQSRRRTSRRAATTTVTSQQLADLQLGRSQSSTRAKHLIDTESDSNGLATDDDIERCREQLQIEEKNRQRLAASACSTPNIKGLNRAATLNAKSTASLMKVNSNLNGPSTPSVMKPHTFITKKLFKPDICGPCGNKIPFYTSVVKCEVCGATAHPECKEKCPLPCVKITAPGKKSCQKKQLISDYVNNDTAPKVPALIVHCCNEIERPDKIISNGLYIVKEDAKQIEDLLLKILKSKSGMPNLSNIDVHVLTGVVKRFLQNLDETLITTTLWSYFAEATKLDNDVESLTHLEYYIKHDLPTANRETLSYLMQHFHAIVKYSSRNNVKFADLTKALAPTIVGYSCRNPDTNMKHNESSTQQQIMQMLFKFDVRFWEQFVQKICTATTPNTPHSRSTLGSRLLNNTPTSHAKDSHGRMTTRSSRIGTTLPTPKMKSLFSG